MGRTGIQVSEVGFAAWAVGGDAWAPVEDDASIAAMRRALELDTNFLDTADVYGDGRSEELVATVVGAIIQVIGPILPAVRGRTGSALNPLSVAGGVLIMYATGLLVPA